MTPKQEAFVQEYLIDLNATQAAIRAGYSAKTAASQGERLLRNVEVMKAVTEAKAVRSERVLAEQDDVVREWLAIAFADPNEVIQFRRTCCRHCHGENHEYQWIDEDEFNKAFALAQSEGGEIPTALPSDGGGYGFRKPADPHADCPKCFGEGLANVFALDTRNLSPAGRRLFAGVKVTRDGFEIKLRDQDKALDSLARHLGMFKERVEHSGPNGGPIQTEDRTQASLLEEAKRLGIDPASLGLD